MFKCFHNYYFMKTNGLWYIEWADLLGFCDSPGRQKRTCGLCLLLPWSCCFPFVQFSFISVWCVEDGGQIPSEMPPTSSKTEPLVGLKLTSWAKLADL